MSEDQTVLDPDGATIPIEDSPQDRFWTHPETGEQLVRVTTALKAVAKDALVPWAARVAVKAVYEELPKVAASYLKKPCGRTWTSKVRCKHESTDQCPECSCTVCRECVSDWLALRHFAESSRRAQEGTEVHETVTCWTRDGFYSAHGDHLAGYVESFTKFIADYGLTPQDFEVMSGRIINREHGYTGTFDGQVRLDASRSEVAAEMCDRLRHPNPLVLIDAKTREKTDGELFMDHTLQLNGYDNGEVLFLPVGNQEVPLPRADALAILQLTPEGYKFQPIVRAPEEFEAFLSALRLFRWQYERGTASKSMRSFPLSEEFKRRRTNERARARRAAKKNQEAERQEAMQRLAESGNPWATNEEIAQEMAAAGSPAATADTAAPASASDTPRPSKADERLRRSVTGSSDPWEVVATGGRTLDDGEIPF